MTEPHSRHAAPEVVAVTKATRTVRFWLVPLIISLSVLAALAGLYLGGILNPGTNIRHFPIAVVNEDAGQTGAQIVDGLVSGLDKNKFDVRVLSTDEATHQLDTAQVYGLVSIPADFSATLAQASRRRRWLRPWLPPTPKWGSSFRHRLPRPTGAPRYRAG
jgi:hypothetical protein